MTQIKLKRVYEAFDSGDGFRVLADRLWPRGIKKEELHYDLWCKEITPSNQLRKWVHEAPSDRWQQFSEMYRKELDNSITTKEFISQIKQYNTVTLLYASKNADQNHAQILKAYLEEKLIE